MTGRSPSAPEVGQGHHNEHVQANRNGVESVLSFENERQQQIYDAISEDVNLLLGDGASVRRFEYVAEEERKAKNGDYMADFTAVLKKLGTNMFDLHRNAYVGDMDAYLDILLGENPSESALRELASLIDEAETRQHLDVSAIKAKLNAFLDGDERLRAYYENYLQPLSSGRDAA